MAEPVVVFENVSKWYRREIEHHNIRSALPGALGNQVAREALVALDDVSFELAEGEALGVIGPNGAGKSTLLKLLARVTAPSRGRVATRGRIASMLELGIGFHNDLSGEENIQFSAAVLGMTPREITRKYDKIVEFSGIGDFMKMPVKRYSTGMKARLGFAVATHVDADILLVDEVMAVGDAEFQRQGFERIRELRNAGVSSVFVAHNVWMVGQLCNWVMRLDHGKVVDQGPATGVIDRYGGVGASSGQVWVKSGAQVLAFSCEPEAIDPGDPLTVRATIEVERPLSGCEVQWGFARGPMRPPEWMMDIPEATAVLGAAGVYDVVGEIETVPMIPNLYELRLEIVDVEESTDDEPDLPRRPLSSATTPCLVRGDPSDVVRPAVPMTWSARPGVAPEGRGARATGQGWSGVTMRPIDVGRNGEGSRLAHEAPRAAGKPEKASATASPPPSAPAEGDHGAALDPTPGHQSPTDAEPSEAREESR